MSIPRKLQERLQFLARVIDRETLHLRSTDQRLFVSGFTVENARSLEDTLGDKLLPAWRSAVGENPATMTDNLDRAERLGLIDSADLWLALRQLRNQMIHDYIEDPTVLANALQTAHAHLHILTDAAHALLNDLAKRGLISRP